MHVNIFLHYDTVHFSSGLLIVDNYSSGSVKFVDRRGQVESW